MSTEKCMTFCTRLEHPLLALPGFVPGGFVSGTGMHRASLSALPLSGQHVLDIAYGNGLTSRRLAALGAQVTAFDSALSNMALFDMADREPLFGTLPRRLKPGGTFVFSLTHPAFNNASSMHVAEEMDLEGEIKTV